MNIFDEMLKSGHEEVNFFYEPQFDLKAIVAIHNSNLVTALGATRVAPYAHEEDAISEALNLSRKTTLSASIINCDLGGAMGILVGDEDAEKSEGYLRAYGRFLRPFGGRFCTMAEAGLAPKDMLSISKEFPNVVGLPEFCGGLGEPHHFIAYGALCAMKACANECFGNPTLDKKKVLVQGVGQAGLYLVKALTAEGAQIIITDAHYDNVKRIKDANPAVQIVRPDEYESLDVDIFSPCSAGGVITEKYLLEKKFKIVAGTAKSPFAAEDLSETAMKLGILYAPDFVINAAEAVFAYSEIAGYDSEHVKHHIDDIYDITSEILVKSKENLVPTDRIAEEMGLGRLSIVQKLKRIYTGSNREVAR